jgi:predicted Fe-Mo cluster-binding NifX family protein
MTNDEAKARAEILRNAKIESGILKQIGPGEYKVISDDAAKLAACFEQAEREWLRRQN